MTIMDNNGKIITNIKSLLTRCLIAAFTLINCMEQVMSLDENDTGRFYLELMTIKENYFVNMLLALMNQIYFIDEKQQKFVHKKRKIRDLLKIEDYDENSILTTEDVFDEFLTAKIDVVNGLIPISSVQYNEKLSEAEELFLNCRPDEAFELFQTLAEKGCARAMYFLGEFYVHPYGHTVENSEEGRKWRIKGAQAGDLLASLNTAYGLPAESAEREEIFNRLFGDVLELAESGDVFAQNEVADLYLNGYGTQRNQTEGFRWLEKSAQAGFWKSINKIGDAYYNGNIREQDDQKAMQWYQKGIDKGYAGSYLGMAYCYYYGRGVDVDNAKAYELFSEAYERGCGEAANMIGIMYYHGYGVPADPEQEFLWMERSAETGYAQGQCNLGNCYYAGRGTAKDLEKAVQWYQAAAERNNDSAATQLGIIALEQNNYEEAVKWFRMAAENGYADAQNRLGVRYDNGQGVAEDKHKAFAWYMKAAEQGHMKAQFNVARGYYYGEGVEEDEEKAREWLRKSAEQGHEDAKELLLEWFGEGSGSGDTEEGFDSVGIITDETYDAIKTACEVFVMTHDGAKYDASYKLKENLGILYEDVYLGHDDTIFKNGKNGFAITRYGVYCRELMASYTNFVTYEELAEADHIYIRDSYIYADDNMIAYITGSKDDKEDLESLFKQIALYVRCDLL